ncbi:MAG: alpha-amylase family glycosyl hydrolase [Woeseiaceae bacterium]|nr:alpha-amylase family glycosyl hydrolase [Woeseiaceae bacterium]
MKRYVVILAASVLLASCAATVPEPTASEPAEFYGTLEPFASEAVYFLLTDRFVDGDPDNNFPDQGGEQNGTFDRPIQLAGSPPGNIGYLGGDFKGVLDNAGYITDMGFTAIWTTPIVDNPDEAFTGGIRPGEGFGADRGKTGYHGYWGVNFFEVDEHLESDGLNFAEFTRTLHDDFGIKYILDVVCNHGSPAYTMPEDQPKYGELYDASGALVADHQNLHPNDLDPDNPLHAFYNTSPDLAELSDMNENNPDVLEYFVAAYTQWLGQGVAAFRVDTVKHMPHSFWKVFTDRMRDVRPGLFMFAESFSFDAKQIAEHTYPENGAISVLDFPGRAAMTSVFGDGGSYAELESYLHLESGVYQNPYDLMTFYDNHDMTRIDADENGFINAHNWLFTSRGIPVVYYGSEIGFRAGLDQHEGNRDYFGQENIEAAKTHRIHSALTRIANIRKASVALQRGLQVYTGFGQRSASFFRVYQKNGEAQTALVLLNGGDDPLTMKFGQLPANGTWTDAVTGHEIQVDEDFAGLEEEIAPNGVRVYLTDAPISDPRFVNLLNRMQANARRKMP